MEQKELVAQFDKVYEAKIRPYIESLEKYRLSEKKKYDKYNKLCTAFVLISILVFASAFIPYLKGTIYTLLFLVGGFVSIFVSVFVFVGKMEKLNNNFRKLLKQKLLNPILKMFGNFVIKNEENISLNEIKSLGLYPRATSKKDDDIIEGIYKNLKVFLVETSLSHTEQRGKQHSVNVTDFNGLLIKIEMNKKFEGITVANHEFSIENFVKLMKVVSKQDPVSFPPEQIEAFLNSPIYSLIKATSKAKPILDKVNFQDGKLVINASNFIKTNNVTRNLEKISLEDTEFNKEFTVYSDNQVEARYLITPSFMERIKNLQLNFMVGTIDFAFKDKYLYLFLGNMTTLETLESFKLCENVNGLFEVGDIHKTLLNKRVYLKAFKELVSIFSMVHYFKLEQKIGL